MLDKPSLMLRCIIIVSPTVRVGNGIFFSSELLFCSLYLGDMPYYEGGYNFLVISELLSVQHSLTAHSLWTVILVRALKI